jgi:hypothetical protein
MNQTSDTVDLMRVIVRQKYVIFVVLLLSVVVYIASLLFLKDVYEVSSMLEIGSISYADGSIAQIERPSQLLEKINSGNLHCLGSDDNTCDIRARNPEGTSIVQIEVKSSKPEILRRAIGSINGLILVNHKEKMNFRKKALEDNIKNLEEEVSILKYNSARNQQTMSSVSDLLIEISKRKEQLVGFSPTLVIKEPTVSTSTTNFSWLLSLLISVFAGLFLGVFCALAREWWVHHSGEISK